jgi:hypothetical protein
MRQELPDRPSFETTGSRKELVSIRGFVYEHTAWRDHDKPLLHHLFYPTGVKARDYKMPRRVLRASADSGSVFCEYGLRWVLLNGSKTKPDPRMTFTEPVLCPQPRARKTCYRDGRWYKYTRSKGEEVIG